jgi:hypothetical protein
MDWQKEFVDTFYGVVKKENTALSRINRQRAAGHCYDHGVADLTEVQLQYLLVRALLSNSRFDKWFISVQDPLSDIKRTKSRKRHVDIALTKTRYGKVDDEAWIYIEMKNMKNGIRKAKEDFKRLHEKEDGLLVYRFGKRRVNLEAKVSDSPEFKRLMRRFRVTTTGDKTLRILGKTGGYELYHFEAMLLSWQMGDA